MACAGADALPRPRSAASVRAAWRPPLHERRPDPFASMANHGRSTARRIERLTVEDHVAAGALPVAKREECCAARERG